MTLAYREFIAQKQRRQQNHGHEVAPEQVHPSLFDFQRDLTRWALRKGRAAIFADTGLGKTRMQLEWARLSGHPALILAPLAVTHQTVREAQALGIRATYCRDQSDVRDGQITLTNYERLDRFDASAFGAVVLDESSILKAFSGVTKRALIETFKSTPYRLCCTATPAPNDLEELCNHADFLGVMKSNEMRSTFFIAENRAEFMKYRLKRHARDAFFRWLASWAMAVKRPSDLGYSDDGFDLPGLEIVPHIIPTDYRPDDALFIHEPKGIREASAVRRGTLAERVRVVADLIADEPTERWLIWCGLNDEAYALKALVPDAVVVEGSDDPDIKAAELMRFAEGGTRVLVSKVRLAGFGLNFQTCARMAFVGMDYSYEGYYQALRRCHRFGQTREVVAHIVLSEPERHIYELVLTKEREAQQLSTGLLAEAREFERAELFAGTSAADSFDPTRPLTVPAWMRESA